MGTLLNRRRYMGNSGGGEEPLPSEYTQLDYIYSNGGAYINTNYQPSGNEQITIDTMITSFPESNNYLQFFGCRKNAVATSKNNYWLGIDSLKKVFVRFGTANPSQSIMLSGTGVRRLFYVDLVNKNISIDGTETLTFTASNIEGADVNVWVFRINSTSTSSLGYNGTGLRIYEFIIKKNGTNVCHLVPAKRNSDNVLGMYDLVARAFRTNAGSGSFSAT